MEKKKNTAIEEGHGFRSVCYRLWNENKVAVFCVLLIVIFALAAIFAPILTPYEYDEIVTDSFRLSNPSASHPLGTDEVGRPCVPIGQTEFRDFVSTYIHVSSRIFFEPLKGTNLH